MCVSRRGGEVTARRYLGLAAILADAVYSSYRTVSGRRAGGVPGAVSGGLLCDVTVFRWWYAFSVVRRRMFVAVP
ncbi:MAG: hypothetical protein LBK41_00115 [Clostridiales bacterium]|nr:hypothetical protein [Clostridiales bacterium]